MKFKTVILCLKLLACLIVERSFGNIFLIYINDLTDDLSSNVKLFADDTSLFSVVHDVSLWNIIK